MWKYLRKKYFTEKEKHKTNKYMKFNCLTNQGDAINATWDRFYATTLAKINKSEMSNAGKDKNLRKFILFWQDCTLVQLLLKTSWHYLITYT